MRPTERLEIPTIQRVGRDEDAYAPRSCAGLYLRYDPNLTTFLIVDMNQANAEDRPINIGGIAEASETLQQVYGLTPAQAQEATGRCIHAFGNKIDLSIVVRMASAEVMGTPEQAPIYVDGIEDPFLRVYASMALAHITASGPPPVMQPGMTEEDADGVVRMLASFGLKMPIDPREERVLGLMAEVGSEAPCAADQVLSDLAEISRLASKVAAASSARDLPALVPQLTGEYLSKLAAQVRGMRVTLAAVTRVVKESLES